MRSASLSVLLSIFMFSGLALAQDTQGPDWISGEVISLGFDGEDGLMGVKLADGEVYNVSVTKNQISDIHIGDYVTVEIKKGWADLIEKADPDKVGTAKPDKEKGGAQWVAGKVASIEHGPENSLISVKMADGRFFNVASSNELLGDIESGDYVNIKIVKGWAQTVTKK